MTEPTPNPPPPPPPRPVLEYHTPAMTGKSYAGLAIAGFVVSLGTFCIGLPASITGLVLSIVALRGMKRSGNLNQRGLAIAGVIIGSVMTTLLLLAMLLFMGLATTTKSTVRVRMNTTPTTLPTSMPAQRP